MDKDFPEETKTNLIHDKEPKELNEVEDEDNETYNSLEEYFLDCCRDGFLLFSSHLYIKIKNIFSDLAEFKDCIINNVDVLSTDRNLNNAFRIIILAI